MLYPHDATHMEKAIDRSPVSPSSPEAGVFACGARAIGGARTQWPRERLARRPAGAGLRFRGLTGNGKNVPSGNSRYRLKTCTCPSRPRLPSITNLVPTGNRLGRRLELYAMATSYKHRHPAIAMCRSINQLHAPLCYPRYPQPRALPCVERADLAAACPT
jgi:hypothetical protein